ncbi:NAD-dependent epimerase/dehydratase family protein [Pseudomonadales bacterium]|nr:NAD-dependent epimerase/dehydratase family protein [Pseudomonadales bacterium]
MSSKKILLTGASGFLGTHVLEALKTTSHDVQCIDSQSTDLSEFGSLKNMSTDFDTIIHLATWTRAGSFCKENIGEQWLVNEIMNLNVLDLWSRSDEKCHLISFGTSVAYGDGSNIKDEVAYLEKDPIFDYYGYSTSKRSLLYGQICINNQKHRYYSHLIPSTIYGPGYHLDGRNLHFIYDIIRKIIRLKHFGDDVVLWGDGLQVRELIYIADVVDILTQTIDNPLNTYMNIASGSGVTIKQFAKEVCGILDIDADEIKYDTNAFVGARTKVLSTSKLDLNFPTRLVTSLPIGLKKTINWMEPLVLSGKI